MYVWTQCQDSTSYIPQQLIFQQNHNSFDYNVCCYLISSRLCANDLEAFRAIVIYNYVLYNYCNLLLHNNELMLFFVGNGTIEMPYLLTY